MSAKQDAVIDRIVEERKRQDEKWGADRALPPMLWLTILIEEVGEVGRAILERDWANLEREVIQVAAVAIAWIEMYDASVREVKR